MTPLTLDELRAMARLQGLDLADDALAGLLPLVQAGRELMGGLDPALRGDVEPTCVYHIG